MSEKRRNLLINRQFQIRFAFFVCSWLLPLSLVYPVIIYKFFDIFINYVVTDASVAARTAVESTRQQMFWLLVFFQLLFLAVTFVISLFMSHRIAGPLYKLSRFFDEVGRGHLNQDLHFRKQDYFTDLAADFNLMLKGIRSQYQHHNETAKKAITELEIVLPQFDAERRKQLENVILELKEIKGNLT